MTIRLPFARHTETLYIRLDTHRCKARWECVQACPQGVLGKVDLRFHRHIHIDEAENCKGCLLCVDTCPQQAILSREKAHDGLPQ